MSSTALEQLRAEHEEIENLERAVVATLGEKPRNHRGRVLHGHKVSNLLDEVVSHSKHAKELYDDEDGIFAEETENMRGRAVFTSFYEQLKSIRSFHRKYPNSVVSHEPNLEGALNPNIQFSGEEHFGKYVDLNEFYLRFLNIPELKWQARKAQEALNQSSKMNGKKTQPGNDSIDYLAYLASFSDFSAIPAAQKTRAVPYQQYLKDLKEYLLDFYRRTQPLVDLDDVIDESSAKFEKKWALHEVPGWGLKEHLADGNDNSGRAHFCELCNKQFGSEGVFKSHFSGKKHKKAAAKEAGSTQQQGAVQNGSNVNGNKDAKKGLEAKQKAIAFDEVLIRRLYELLTEVVHATISYLELKQTRTHEELQAEIAEEEEGTFSDVDVENENEDADDEEEQFYNPLNLPLGWDGKPIPYWLYKLHGLGVEYKCEICGNHTYWGRRAFDRHFQEWRHAFGMRCLKIPNTKHFHDITLMRDAIQLYEKLKDQIDAESWNASNEEEFEDSEGNVLNRKTYEDLARQGLL
ncbi:hypothetical protein BBO99_00001167 [Phytophthora kernoviae]|uniref:C2H2-type domain-containing protein n=2 Tax=Phytophthora kernoviae TaxID=325452 RepID=A0A3R7H2A4_9STRA|nr:hypothetical protein G195_005136 [Phytophthora kernoviae 00238/432]KAG2529625.1 hypothetical protein JM18_001399 [Phytophthora kernoviae]KAG2531167.1 hypothetical protein JM16_001263 [Phytophthora kernoviae]RLN26638.1 hypothetical protein BBI17_004068 [Phytophthora kernoviae]RLN84686.1 hypothetical protein BBO99_00001167 [Phytophthora kernoviae]